MAQFKPFVPGVEVNGQTVLSVVDGLGSFRDIAFSLLKSNGIDDPKPNQWYSQAAWLKTFEVIAAKLGPKSLTLIGKKIPENADFPPEIDSIVKALAAIDVAYHMNHRGGEIGHYSFSSTGAHTARMVCNNPYPCEFDYGIIVAMGTRFAPTDAFVKVTHDDTQPCRKNGADSCTYLVSW